MLLTLSYAPPITTLFLQGVSSDAGTIGVMLAETLLLNEALTGLAKTLVARPRPYTYNLEVPEIAKQDPDSSLSFFSAHASYTEKNHKASLQSVQYQPHEVASGVCVLR